MFVEVNMETALLLQDNSSLCMIAACALVFIRWVWLLMRMVNIEVFMTQIEKLVRANNTDRAIKLCHAIPGESISQGTLAVLQAHRSGQKMSRTDVLEAFHGALRGGSVSTATDRFRTLKTISFFLAVAGLLSHVFELGGVATFGHFWIITVVFFLLFGSATAKASKMEHDLSAAAGRLVNLCSEDGATEDNEQESGRQESGASELGGGDPEVDSEVDRTRGEGHLEIRQAYEDSENAVDEIHAGGIEALLLLSFKKEHKLDLRQDENAMKRIREAAQKAAYELRSQSETEINLPFITADSSGPLHLLVKAGRKQALVFSRKHPPAGGFSMPSAPAAAPSLVRVEPFPSPSPSSSMSSTPSPAGGKAVLCRNCSETIPIEPEILATIEGEFDLWTKVKTRCPKCGGSFFELKM